MQNIHKFPLCCQLRGFPSPFHTPYSNALVLISGWTQRIEIVPACGRSGWEKEGTGWRGHMRHVDKSFQIPSVFSGVDLDISQNCFLLKKSTVFGREAQEKGHPKQRKGGGVHRQEVK